MMSRRLFTVMTDGLRVSPHRLGVGGGVVLLFAAAVYVASRFLAAVVFAVFLYIC